MSYWIVHLLNGISFGMVLFLMAAGLSLIFGLMRIVNLTHGALYLLGTYVALSINRFTNSFPLAVITGAYCNRYTWDLISAPLSPALPT